MSETGQPASPVSPRPHCKRNVARPPVHRLRHKRARWIRRRIVRILLLRTTEPAGRVCMLLSLEHL
jgi:hypothetical protein